MTYHPWPRHRISRTPNKLSYSQYKGDHSQGRTNNDYKQKDDSKPGVFLSVINSWCSIKDDYRTLAELEDVSVVNLYTDIDEEETDE